MNLYEKARIIEGIASLTDSTKFLNLYSLLKSYIRPYVIILVYHRIGTFNDDWAVQPTELKDFEIQMKYLKETYNIISLEEMANLINTKKSIPKKAVVITFDDGYKDNYTNAFPILKKYRIPSTIFLTTGHIDTNIPFWWDILGYVLYNSKQKKLNAGDLGDISIYPKNNLTKSFYDFIEKLKKMPENKKHIIIDKIIENSDVEIPENFGRDLITSWDEVKEMNENGIEFGAHTVNHPILTRISLQQVKNEIMQSKKDIEKRINKPITTFCYPNGLPQDFNEDIKNLIKDNGFICASTIIPKPITTKTDLFELGRIPPGLSPYSFKFCLSGLYSDIYKLNPLK